MQKGGYRVSRDTLIRYSTAALIVYGAVGVAVHLRLLSLVVEGVRGWLVSHAVSSAPLALPWLDPLHAHYDARPWLPWAAWLFAVGLLAWKARREAQDVVPSVDTDDAGNPASWLAVNIRWVSLGILLLLLLIGGYTRLNQLLPQSVGISQNPYDDEGVYVGASQLFLQGILPYRDYFFAHPPIAAVSYAPALLYHFNEWGSPTSFMMARYLSVAYSLLTLVLLFYIGKRLAGLWGGALVGLLWALDGRVVEINRKVMLDGPMVLLSCAALLLYLRVRQTKDDGRWTTDERRRTMDDGRWTTDYSNASEIRNYMLIGAVGALSALTKIAGVACLLAIVADMVWLGLEGGKGVGARFIAPSAMPAQELSLDDAEREPGRDKSRPYVPMRRSLLAVLGGATIAALIVLGPFLILAPSEFFRQVFFFQLLRPGDGLIDVPSRIADLTSTLANALTPLFASLGFIALSLHLWTKDEGRRTKDDSKTLQIRSGGNPQSAIRNWRVVALWTALSLLVFTYSRSFYGHYYIQLAAPLCLLGAGVSLIPGLVRDAIGGFVGVRVWLTRYTPVALLVFIALPLVATEWSGVTARRENRKFEIVARYVNDAVPPGTPVLTTDEQFNFLAARPPSRNATGYLVDSYGHLIYLGLGLNNRDWGDLWGDVFGGERSNDVYSALWKSAPQSDLLDRARMAPLIVIHDTGEARFTRETLSAIEAQVDLVEEQRDYKIYRR